MSLHVVVEESASDATRPPALQDADDTVRIAALRRVTRDQMESNTDIVRDVRIALLSPAVDIRCAALECWQRTEQGFDADVQGSLRHREGLVRIAALYAVIGWGHDIAVAACRIALRDTQDDVVRVALQIIQTHRLPIEPAILATHLDHSDPIIVSIAAALMAHYQDVTAQLLVDSWLDEYASQRQLVMVRTVGRVGLQTSIPRVRAMLLPHHPCLRAAIVALGRLRDRAALRPLLSFLCHLNDDVRADVVQSLIHIGDPAIAPALSGALCDERAYVRSAALQVMLALELPVPPEALLRELPFLRHHQAEKLLTLWLVGDVAVMSERLRIIHQQSDWVATHDARVCIRHIITAHPHATEILCALNSLGDARLAATLQPFYLTGVLPLPSVATLSDLLACGTGYRGTSLRPLADTHIRRDPQTLLQFWKVADESFHRYYGEQCLLTLDPVWHATIVQTASHSLYVRVVRVLKALLPITPGYVARLPVSMLAWIEAGAATANLGVQADAEAVVAAWRGYQHAGAVLPEMVDVYADIDGLRAFWGTTTTRLVHHLIQLHRNPLMRIDPPRRAVFRRLIQEHHESDALCTNLNRARLPTLALTLLPWYCDGSLPWPPLDLIQEMYALCDDATRDLLVRYQPGAAEPIPNAPSQIEDDASF